MQMVDGTANKKSCCAVFDEWNSNEKGEEARQACFPLGEVKIFLKRAPGVCEVHF